MHCTHFALIIVIRMPQRERELQGQVKDISSTISCFQRSILPSLSSTQFSQRLCPTCQHSQCHNVVQFCDFEDKVCSSTVVHSTRYAVQPILISPAKIFIACLFLQTLPKLKDFCPEMHDLRVFSTISFIQLEFGDRNHLGER